MTAFGKAAADYENCVSELSSGSDSVELGDYPGGTQQRTRHEEGVAATAGAPTGIGSQGQSSRGFRYSLVGNYRTHEFADYLDRAASVDD